jgi:hypothetical protein
MRLKSRPALLATSGVFLLVLGACVSAPGSDDELGTLPGKPTGGSATSSAGTTSSSSAGTTSSVGTAGSGGGTPEGNAGATVSPQAGTASGGSSGGASKGGSGGLGGSAPLGFMQFGTTPATEMWIDEVALSDARVGCGN